MTLNAAFAKIFEERLDGTGFRLISLKKPLFIRIINNEIVQIITFSKVPGNPIIDGYLKLDYNEYQIICGLATIYRKKINFSNFVKFINNMEIYTFQNPFNIDMNYRASIHKFPYKESDEQQMLESLINSFNITQQNSLLALNEVKDLNDCINFFYQFNCPIQIKYDYSFDISDCNEGLLQIIVDDANSLYERENRYLNLSIDIDEAWGESSRSIDEKRQLLIRKSELRKQEINQMFNDHNWFISVMNELERRKEANIEILRNYKLL